jgi:hypothetical protein
MVMSEVNYSVALRCIGQDLERRGLNAFVLKRDGSHYVVVRVDRAPDTAVPKVIRYTASDLEMIDRCGETQRGDKVRQEFLHRAQMLRAIGDYLDKYGSTLISIIYNYNDSALRDSPFRVEYLTREGEHMIDDRPGAAIFDECVLMFQKRGQTPLLNRGPRGDLS